MSQYSQHGGYAPPAPRNGLGLAALILGIVGLPFTLTGLTAWIAIILGLIAVPLALAGLGRVRRGQATNKGATIAGLVVGLLAVVLGIVSTVVTLQAIDEAFSGPTATQVSAAGAAEQPEAVQGPVPAGTTLDVDGLQVTAGELDEREDEMTDRNMLCSAVSYVNGGDDVVHANPFDWQVRSPEGVATSVTMSLEDDTLRSGDLSPGGRLTGSVCFDHTRQAGEHVILYRGSLFADSPVEWASTVQ